MAVTAKQRHHQLETRRRRRRTRIADRTPKHAEAREEYRVRVLNRGINAFGSFYKAMGDHNAARARTVRIERQARQMVRDANPDTVVLPGMLPLTERRMELVPLKNGVVNVRPGGRLVRHEWTPVDLETAQPKPKRRSMLKGVLKRAKNDAGGSELAVVSAERPSRALRSTVRTRGARSV